VTDRVVPDPVGLNAEFYAHAATGTLHFQRCDDCATWRHPPRFLCAGCGSDRWSWQASSGRGRVFTWTVTHRQFDPAFEPPYAIVVVETDEGVRVVGAPRDLEPSDLALDLPVDIVLDPVTDTIALLTFRPTA
jgi:uncharacterized OB-fold protein